MNFEHDGLHDSLTRLAAPPYFYESLRREIAIANRSGAEITAIRLILESNAPVYLSTIVSLADLITNSFRYEDVKARLGNLEFAIFIQDKKSLAVQISQRLVARWAIEGTPDSSIAYSVTQYIPSEEPVAFLNRLDEEELIRSKF
jgi:GGDEF domain-containing protein